MKMKTIVYIQEQEYFYMHLAEEKKQNECSCNTEKR